MPVARPETSDSRVIAHVDMDCFYVQVEQRKQPELRGQPTAVVQYNEWKGGGLIAVSYEARKYGVKRSMRGDEAKQVCPEIQLVRVPVARGKADLTIYRNAGSEVVAILARKGRCERASIDEVYLDLTEASEKMLSETPPESLEAIDEEVIKSHILGLDVEGNDVREAVKEWICRRDADHRDKLLACGAFIVAELRLQVLKETQFSCSAGIAHNKMLAKLSSGMNKPAQQTVVPLSSVRGLLESLPIKKMKQLGGKLGSSLQNDLGVNTVGDLLQFSEEKLQERYGINTGTWLWNISRGINGDEVQGRLLPKSHGTGKLFPGVRSLKKITTVELWLSKFSEELSERLQYDMEQNKRIARTLTLHATAYKSNDSDSHKKFPSKSCPLRYGAAKIQEDALSLFQAALREYLESNNKTQGNRCSGWGINSLTLSASKIVDIPSGTCSIMKYFQSRDQLDPSSKELDGEVVHEAVPLSYLEPHSLEPQIEYYEEEKWTEDVIPSHSEDERIMSEDKETSMHMRSICDQNPSCSSSKRAQDDFSGDTSPSTEVKKAEPQLKSIEEESRIKSNVDGIRPREQKRKESKDKVKSSILRFFQSQNCSSAPEPRHELASAIHERKPSFFSESSTSRARGVRSVGQNEERTNTWNYKIDEIDPTVIDELPREIQEEVRAWLRPHKRANTVKRGSSIAHYFLPDKNT